MSESQNVVQLEVDKILVPEDRVTSVLDDEILAELEESIRQHGILQPLQVALVNDKYVLIDGLHRMLIAKKLGMLSILSIVFYNYPSANIIVASDLITFNSFYCILLIKPSMK